MSKPVYSWDASIFVAWLTEDSSVPLGDIDEVAQEIDEKRAVLVVPSLVFSEILQVKNDADKMRHFRSFMTKENVIVADITVQIAEKTGDIRGRGLLEKDQRKLSVPDAVYLAVAIIYKVDALHALDDKMLSISGKPIVDGLKITKPLASSRQPRLF